MKARTLSLPPWKNQRQPHEGDKGDLSQLVMLRRASSSRLYLHSRPRRRGSSSPDTPPAPPPVNSPSSRRYSAPHNISAELSGETAAYRLSDFPLRAGDPELPVLCIHFPYQPSPPHPYPPQGFVGSLEAQKSPSSISSTVCGQL